MPIVLTEQEKLDMKNGKSWQDILQARGVEVKEQQVVRAVEDPQKTLKAEYKQVCEQHRQAIEQYRYHVECAKEQSKIRNALYKKKLELKAKRSGL